MDKPSLEESLRALAARRRSGENHPAPEELVAYRGGDLTAEEDDRIQEHLTQCHDCARLLLDLAEFEQLVPPPEEIGPVDARAEASWQRLRSRLREEGELEVEPPPPVLQHRPPARVPVWRRPAIPWTLAAGLALGVVGLGLRTGSLERQLADLTRPQTVRTVSLVSEEDITRGGEEAPAHAGEGVAYELFLSADPDVPIYPLYEVELVPAAGSAKPVRTGRQAAEGGLLRVLLRAAPEPGDYYFQVLGIRDGREAPVGRYPFTVLPARQSSG